MNGSNNNHSLLCNRKQISTNLPLKKRGNYRIDIQSINDEQDENISKKKKLSHSSIPDESLRVHIPSSPVVPTRPSSSHLELFRQHYAYLLSNSTNLFHPSIYENFFAEKLHTQRQHSDYYRTFLERQQTAYSAVGSSPIIDEHFSNYHPMRSPCLTPDDSQSISVTPVDSIEEHFARSLAKFWSSKKSPTVDDHFAKALGSTTWEKLKDKS